MLVRTLIEALSQCDPEQEVWIRPPLDDDPDYQAFGVNPNGIAVFPSEEAEEFGDDRWYKHEDMQASKEGVCLIYV